MIGPIINSAGVVAGSVLGAALGKRIPQSIRERLPMAFGIASMGMGISMVVKVNSLPPVILSLLLGTVIGELLRLENGVRKLAGRARGLVEKTLPFPHTGIGYEEFLERFVAILVLFCASGTGIFGAMREGMTGDASLLIIKAFLDFFTAAIFATSLGYTLAAAALPQFLIQLGLFYAASLIVPLTNNLIMADFSALGGLIMLATGFRICNLLPIQLTNMVPAMVLVMPFSVWWSRIIF
jgi:uncharacterized membrane protein YqgA involved in biofilm formation